MDMLCLWRFVPALAVPTPGVMLPHSEINCHEILAMLRVLLAQGQIQGQQLPVVGGWSTRGGQWQGIVVDGPARQRWLAPGDAPGEAPALLPLLRSRLWKLMCLFGNQQNLLDWC